ncbi:hypothetical protein SAMN06295974_0727 [Plantibacter flavus]|uniref:Uncharacterized protein n=1 Tax=Plantibacter flavus TaxID=150123 RepID=A0A3N2C1V6_9MICO|nr:hypothetical protein [Plantibacter flavus]ROR81491.1 hypothetical protein EDD42_1553 [Plantibacter flavus]SMG13594.1 hypothetical protein SAMN06295974_0727 [Plantibacter flavus]
MSEQDDRTGATSMSSPADAATGSAPSEADQTATTESTRAQPATAQPNTAHTADEPRTNAGPKDRGGRPPRFGTILWGVLLLVFAGAMLVTNLTEVRIDPLGWITGAIIATGAVLVIAGIAAALRRRP